MLTGTRDNPRGTHGMRSFECQWHEPLWDVASLVHTSQTHPTLPIPRQWSWSLLCAASSGQDDAGEWGLGSRELRAAGERSRLGLPGKGEATHEEKMGQRQTRGSLTVHGNLHLLHVPEGQWPRQVPGHRPRAEDHGHGHHQPNLHRDSVSPGSRAPTAAAPGPARRSPAAGRAHRCPGRAAQRGTSRSFSTIAAVPAPRR